MIGSCRILTQAQVVLMWWALKQAGPTIGPDNHGDDDEVGLSDDVDGGDDDDDNVEDDFGGEHMCQSSANF